MLMILRWPACRNVRDVGGLPLVAGGMTALGVLVRSDCHDRLGSAGRAELDRYGVTAIIDLRDDSERSRYPSPYQGSARYRPVPVDVDAIDGHYGSLGETYVAILRQRGVRFAAAVTAIAATDGCAVVHCHAGRDRTGLVAAVTLAAVGVERSAIVADYMRSVPPGPSVVSVATPGRMRTFLAASMSDIEAALDYLDGVGGARSYLRDGGLSDDLASRLDCRLRAAVDPVYEGGA
ncbi:MAG TPA: tyrosine-protein phosphatase [Streptosporangiaceae bacterium]|nr:tyrosine-protein phosphatase [Streptosporangiaceae bacterium]